MSNHLSVALKAPRNISKAATKPDSTEEPVDPPEDSTDSPGTGIIAKAKDRISKLRRPERKQGQGRNVPGQKPDRDQDPDEDDVKWDPDSKALVTARQIELTSTWGQVFEPLDLVIEGGKGLSVIALPPGEARTALMMAICGRMRLTKGSIVVLGIRDNPKEVFRKSAIACFDELDGVKPAVTVQDLVTEQIRWNSPWHKRVPRAGDSEVREMCEYVFGDEPLPPLKAFVEDLPELQQLLLRIAIANTGRPPLLVVGRLDRIADDRERERLVERLLDMGQNQSIVSADVNAEHRDSNPYSVVEIPEFSETIRVSR
ncbi:MAG: hypothetical protein WBP55_00740 [Solirubrobacterales bacterium]